MYVGKKKNKYLEDAIRMSQLEFDRLLDGLTPSFRNLVQSMGLVCAEDLRKFLGELSTPNLITGIFQVGGNDVVRQIIHDASQGDLSSAVANIEYLQKYAPLLIDILTTQSVPPYLIFDVMKDISEALDGLFEAAEPQNILYGRTPTEQELPLNYFPNFPPLRGKANYQADKNRVSRDPQLCNKYPKKHKTLSPGIFSIYCNHGILYGLHLMESHESPRIAFELLMTYFTTMPKIIIYDNACHLMTYCLKREPARFKNTKFLIDRFHSSGHKCTKGYHMSTYNDDELICTINSQLVEQENKRFKTLNSQIANMTSENAIKHLAVIFGIRNYNNNVKYLLSLYE